MISNIKTTAMECPICDHPNVTEVTQTETLTVPNGTVEYVAKHYHCPNCNTKFVPGGVMDTNLRNARQAYARFNNEHGLNTIPELVTEKIYDMAAAYDLTTQCNLTPTIIAVFQRRDLLVINRHPAIDGKTKRITSWRKKTVTEINTELAQQEWR